MRSFKCYAAAALLAMICAYPGFSQTLASIEELPDAPGIGMQTAAANRQTEEPRGSARVEGVVLDLQGSIVPGAKVILTAPGKLGERATVAASDGTFAFTSLPAGKFRLIVTASNLEAFASAEFIVRPGETVQAPKIGLRVSTSSSVDVFATDDQVAEAQVHEQEKQRVLGVFQNFYTSYIWNAEPMPVKQKYKLAFRTIGDPTTFLVLSGVAGAEQYNGTYPGYGPGIEGYGKRYGAALADSITGRIIGSAILPSLLHQDPRYFYQGSGGARSRAWHAVSSALVCRGDNGKLQPNYSHVLGNLAAGGIANFYHPVASRGLGLTFQTLGITTGANALGNLFREFVLRGLVPSVPDYANGKK